MKLDEEIERLQNVDYCQEMAALRKKYQAAQKAAGINIKKEPVDASDD